MIITVLIKTRELICVVSYLLLMQCFHLHLKNLCTVEYYRNCLHCLRPSYVFNKHFSFFFYHLKKYIFFLLCSYLIKDPSSIVKRGGSPVGKWL